MNKILPALAGLLITAGAATACGVPGSAPIVTPTDSPGLPMPTVNPEPGQPRGLTGQGKKAPTRPIDVEAKPWTGVFSSNNEIQEFRIVVDEVWRYCLVNPEGGMACFSSSDAP